MTRAQAAEIIEMHDIRLTIESEEEVELLSENNPSLLEAYIAFCRFAESN